MEHDIPTTLAGMAYDQWPTNALFSEYLRLNVQLVHHHRGQVPIRDSADILAILGRMQAIVTILFDRNVQLPRLGRTN